MDYAEACNQKIAREGSVNEDIVKVSLGETALSASLVYLDSVLHPFPYPVAGIKASFCPLMTSNHRVS